MRMGIIPEGILSKAEEQTLLGCTDGITLGGRTPLDCGMGFRGPTGHHRSARRHAGAGR